ncbi:hypothetical protein Bbelb_413700 [Branchiostoma belcheri]|nr:hypothetical protein Bbelb_413700 [Branchiostoma belcheri]
MQRYGDLDKWTSPARPCVAFANGESGRFVCGSSCWQAAGRAYPGLPFTTSKHRGEFQAGNSGPCGVLAGLRPKKLRALCLLLAAVLQQAVCESAAPAEKTSHQSKATRLLAERVKRNYGPNICFNRGQQQCCPGWQRSAVSGQCLQAHCPFGCGNGVCIAPYTCRCPTGPHQGYHISCQDDVENTLRPDVYSVQEGLPPLPVDLSKEHSTPYRRIRVLKRITIKKRPKVPPRQVDQDFNAAALVEPYPVAREVVESTGGAQDPQYVDREEKQHSLGIMFQVSMRWVQTDNRISLAVMPFMKRG